MVSVSVFRVFAKWHADFLMRVITLIFTNQRDAPSNKWMLPSYQSGRGEFFQWCGLFRSWYCRRRVECYCWKVNCCSLVPGFAVPLGQIWKLGAARRLRSCSQPLAPSHMLTHLFSHWVSPWRKIPQGKQNKTMNKPICLCWSISLSQCGWWQALLPPQKLGSEGFGWGWLADRGRRTAAFELSAQLYHIPQSNHTKRTVKGGPQPSQGTGWCLHTEVKREP